MSKGSAFLFAAASLALCASTALANDVSLKKEAPAQTVPGLSPAEMQEKQQALQSPRLTSSALTSHEMAEKQAAAARAERLLQLREARKQLDAGLPLTRSQRQLLTEEAEGQVQPKGQQVDEGGPDLFGNTWIMTGDEGGPEFFWVDLPAEDRNVLTFPGGNDSYEGPFEMPAPLSFYGESYTTFWISAKGFFGFAEEQMQQWTNSALPNAAAPNAQIYVFWDDFAPLAAGEHYWGVDEGGRLVVTWQELNIFPAGPANVTVQAVVDFENNIVYANYQNFSEDMNLLSCTGGIESPGGEDALQVFFDGTPFAPSANTTIQYNLAPPPDYALSLAPDAITFNTTPGVELLDSFQIFNAGLLENSYSLSIETDLIDFVLLHNGSPVANTGILQPGEAFEVHVSGTVPEETPTSTDLATVTVTSDNGEASRTLPVTTQVFNAAGGGPDAFGNTWVSSAGGDQEFFWVELAEEDREYHILSDDGQVGPIPMNGVISYYGDPYTDVYIGSNGIVGFSPDFMTSLGNTALPVAGTPNNLIALFWDDLDPADGGQVYSGNDETGRFVVTYDAVIEYPAGPGNVTVQAVFDFEQQKIFANMAALDDGILLNECTIGMENADGTDGLQVIFDGTPGQPAAEWTVRYDLAPPPDYAVDISENLDVVGAEDGVYEAWFSVYNSGLLVDSYDLVINDEGQQLQYSLIDEEGDEISSIGPVDPLDSATVGIRMTVGEDPGVVQEGFSVTACSQMDDQACATMTVSVTIVPTGGADAWGNSWISSLSAEGPEYAWIDLPEEDRVPVVLTDDSYAGPYDLPGGVTFYGGAYNSIYIGSNGMLSFAEDGMFSLGNTDLPNEATPNALIAWFWDDLNPSAGGTVYTGETEDGLWVMTFDTVPEFGGEGAITAQVVIDTDNGEIWLNYEALEGGLDVAGCTIGLENEDGTIGMPITVNALPLVPAEQSSFLITLAPPPDYWFAVSDSEPLLGTPEETVVATFTIDNVGLSDDSYTLFADNADGFGVQAMIDGTPVFVTPTVPAGESLEIEMEIEVPEIPAVSQTISTMTVTSNGNTDLGQDGTVLLNVQLVQGGPDGYGYFWSTTDADGQVEYDWYTMENPVPLALGDDSSSEPLDLGFTWNHYGNDYSQVIVGSNGIIGFSADGMNSLGNFGGPLPQGGTPNNLIAFFWDDLNPSQGGTVSYEAAGDLFVVQYEGVPEYFNGPGSLTAQVILDLDEEAIRVNYQSLANGIDVNNKTIGIEDASGSVGLSASYQATGWTPTDMSAIWFGFNVIGPSGPYAVDVDPDEVNGIGLNGGFAEYELEVENRGENNSTFELEVEGNAWDVTFHDVNAEWAPITQVPELAYDEVFLLGVRHAVPEEPASFTDQALVTVSATMEPAAFAEVNILTSASCNHVEQVTQNLTGTGLFGMTHLSDGDWMGGDMLVWIAQGVNRMATLDMTDGTVGDIMVMPVGPDYRGVAVDDRDGSYWLTHENGLYHVDAGGTEIGDYTIDLLGPASGRMATGLAFDADNNMLWAMCSTGGSDDLVRIDVSDASNPVGLTAVAVPWTVPFGSGAAGIDYHEETDQLVAINTATGDVECFLDLMNGNVDARGDFCPSGQSEGYGLAMTSDGMVFIGSTNGLAHPVDMYQAPCDFGVSVGTMELPTEFALSANYPNPFNPSTMLRYALPVGGQVQLDVYNLLGQHQQTLAKGMRPAGFHEVRFDGSALSSGVYFYRLSVQDRDGKPVYSDVRKMMLMK